MEMGNLMNASLKALLNEQYKLVAELREENKKLKEYNGELIENHKKDIAILCEENKKLNIKVASLEGEIKGLNSVIEKLKEENQTLELWLDNKEKVNKSLREELSKYKKQYEHSMGEDNGKLTKGGYASFNEYGELMEEDTLQELRDIGEL